MPSTRSAAALRGRSPSSQDDDGCSTRPFHSDALLWPKKDRSAATPPPVHGYVIGWQDVERWDSGGLTDEGGAPVILARTTICASILPAGANTSSAGQSDSNGYSLDDINEALQKLRARYKCRRQAENENNDSSDALSGDDQHIMCSCCTCACIQGLKVVAIRDGPTGTPTTASRTTDSSELLSIQATPAGPWWQDDEPTRQSGKNQSTFRELIWYNRLCGSDALGHYKLDGSTPSDLNHIVGFRRTLMRLSESPNIAEELAALLMNDGQLKSSHLSQESFTIRKNDDDDDDGDNDESIEENDHAPDSSLQRLLIKIQKTSLTVMHCTKRSLQSSPRSPIISQIPIIYSLQCLVQYTGDGNNTGGKTTKGQEIFLSREIRAEKHLLCASKLGHAALDGILGLILGLFLLKAPDSIRFAVSSLWNAIHGHLLRENIGWLETFPVGFKLNVPLTTNMGREILLVVSNYEQVLSAVIGPPLIQTLIVDILGIVGAVFGFTTVAAIVFDATRLSTVHIHLISTIFTKMFRALFYTQASLWKLFRGKKLNPLRHRTDTLEYDSMQLLLGTILFTTCLFSFTTILVYYIFFMVVNLSVAGCAVVVWAVYSIVQAFPLGGWLVRLLHPNHFPRTVYFSHKDGDMSKDIHVSSLVSVTQLASSQAFTIAFSNIFPRFLERIPAFIGEVISGTPTTIICTCLDISQS